MDALLDFFKQNSIFTIIIIVGIISSLLGKSKQRNRTAPRRQYTPVAPTFGNPHRTPDPAFDREFVRRTEEVPVIVVDKKMRQSNNIVPDSYHGEIGSHMEGADLSDHTAGNPIFEPNELTLDQRQIINGVIWSEILGRPKSRRYR